MQFVAKNTVWGIGNRARGIGAWLLTFSSGEGTAYAASAGFAKDKTIYRKIPKDLSHQVERLLLVL